MANPQHSHKFNEGSEEWNRWRQECPEVQPDLEAINLEDRDLSGYDLSHCLLNNASFLKARMSGAVLNGASLVNAKFNGCQLEAQQMIGADLTATQFTDANLTGADLSGSLIERTRFDSANLSDADLSGARGTDTHFPNANLSSADLSHASLTEAFLAGARLSGSDLRNTDLSRARFKDNLFDQVKIGATKLTLIEFHAGHEVLRDRSDQLVIGRLERLLSWEQIRRLGSLPLFGVSWIALILSLATVNGVGLLNEHRFLLDIEYPVPIPHRMGLILLATVLLVFASTLYRMACPVRIQEFSESQWVEEHGHPRLQYIADQDLRPLARWVTFAFYLVGGGLATWLITERIADAVVYIWTFGFG